MRVWSAAVLGVVATALAACSPTDEPTAGEQAAESGQPASLTIYSGRSERLVGPLLDQFQQDRGIDVQVRYASTAELAATLSEEGAATPADVFFAQDGGALGALSGAGLLQPLPDSALAPVAPRYRSSRGDWIGLSGRPRVLVYNTERIAIDELPTSLEAVTDPRYRGRFGLAPENASFQAHMAVYGAVQGMDRLTELLAGIVANEPRTYDGNTAIVRAVIAGEVDFGLTNHYYLWNARREQPDAPAANFMMPGGDASSFVNVAGIGVLRPSPAAEELVAYLVGEPGQRYFAEQTFEYPLAAGFSPREALLPLEELSTAEIDFERVGEALPEALRLIRESGLVP